MGFRPVFADPVVTELDGEFADRLVEFDDFISKIFCMRILFMKIN